MNHSFQNVRDRLGSILINIFEADLNFVGGHEPECPRLKTFIAEVVSKTQIMNTDFPQQTPMEVDQDGGSGSTDTEYDQAVRLFKTGKIYLDIMQARNNL